MPQAAPPTPINQPDAGGGSAPTTVGTDAQTGSGGSPGQPGGEPAGNGGGGSGGGGGPSGGQPVPEPSTLLLVGTGLAGVALLRRRRQPQST